MDFMMTTRMKPASNAIIPALNALKETLFSIARNVIYQ